MVSSERATHTVFIVHNLPLFDVGSTIEPLALQIVIDYDVFIKIIQRSVQSNGSGCYDDTPYITKTLCVSTKLNRIPPDFLERFHQRFEVCQYMQIIVVIIIDIELNVAETGEEAVQIRGEGYNI